MRGTLEIVNVLDAQKPCPQGGRAHCQGSCPRRKAQSTLQCFAQAPPSVIERLSCVILGLLEERAQLGLLGLGCLANPSLQLSGVDLGGFTLVLVEELRTRRVGAGLLDREVGADLFLEPQLPRV